MTNTTIQRTGIGAVAASAIALFFANVYNNSAEENGNAVFFFVSLAICAAVALWLFRSVIPQSVAAGNEKGARRAMTIAALGLLFALPAFWSGLAYVLGTAGAVLGSAERERGAGGMAVAAIVLGVIAVITNTAIIALDELG